VIACKKAAFNSNEEGASNPTKESSILVVHPIYSECENLIGGVFKAQVNSTGCDFRPTRSRQTKKPASLTSNAQRAERSKSKRASRAA
jgi:hypothetical protein